MKKGTFFFTSFMWISRAVLYDSQTFMARPVVIINASELFSWKPLKFLNYFIQGKEVVFSRERLYTQSLNTVEMSPSIGKKWRKKQAIQNSTAQIIKYNPIFVVYKKKKI